MCSECVSNGSDVMTDMTVPNMHVSNAALDGLNGARCSAIQRHQRHTRQSGTRRTDSASVKIEVVMLWNVAVDTARATAVMDCTLFADLRLEQL